MKTIDVSNFLDQIDEDTLLIDARSPSEFLHAHIPGATNIPLMQDNERHLVGIEYKQKGREAAVILGYRLIGHQFEGKLRKALETGKKRFLVYCWRGGLRSNLIAQLIQTAGYPVQRLEGGYKAYRARVMEVLNKPYRFLVIGGKTGTGKTEIIKQLQALGETALDLETLANHRGSAFGALGLGAQPGYEQFENLIADALSRTHVQDLVWIENESRLVGNLKIPDVIYSAMRSASVVDIQIGLEERIHNILKEYGDFSIAELKESTCRLQRKLGGLRLNQAIEFLENRNLKEWVVLLLGYYDENYAYSSSQRDPKSIFLVDFSQLTKEQRISALIELKSAKYANT